MGDETAIPLSKDPERGEGVAQLGKFRTFFKGNKEVLFLIVGLCAAPIVVDQVFSAGPPWPASMTCGMFTSVVIWLTTIYTYVTNSDNSIAVIKKQVRIWSLLVLIFLILYACLFVYFVYPA